MSKADLENRIEGALEQMRPFFKADGGDMKLIGIDSDMYAQIELHGACSSCSMKEMSLRAGEEAILKVAPEIKGIKVVNQSEFSV